MCRGVLYLGRLIDNPYKYPIITRCMLLGVCYFFPKMTSLKSGTQVCVTPYLVLFLEEVCDMRVRYYLVLQTSLKTIPKEVFSPKYFQSK